MSISLPLAILNVRRGTTDSRQWYESGIVVPTLLPASQWGSEVIVSSGVTPVGSPRRTYEGKPNHAWMSPDNALIYVDNIRDALIKYDPANAQTYQRNADTYKAKITQTLAPLRKRYGTP